MKNFNLSSASPDKLAHTYSIVARNPETGKMGVAVQSHWFSVGSLVSWAEAGVGAVATQSLINPSFGPRGLALLKAGQTAPRAVKELIASDEGRAFRQVAIVDAQGHAAAYTGPSCIPEAGHYQGDNFSVQANLMLNDRVWPEMAHAFETSRGPLAERMIAALEAAQAAGGDIRGRQSAAILVVRGEATGNIWEDRLIDLRVEDHAEPVKELKRVLHVFRAYEYMNDGDTALEKNEIELALQAYSTAETMLPHNLEVKYWHAISLANVGRVAEALPMFKAIFAQEPNWVTITQRLMGVELLKVDEAELATILAQQ